MTNKQTQVYDFIRAYAKIHGFPPSYADIAKGLGMKARSNIHRMVHKLRREGMLSLRSHKFRSVQIADRSVDSITAL
jgi:repressor LexA